VTEWSFTDRKTDVSEAQTEESARSLRADLGIIPNVPVILYAGNFQEYQGVDILIEAISIVRQAHPSAVLVLLGASKGDRTGRLERRYGGALIVCPRQPHELVASYLQMAQILVSPRKWGNNLPFKVFEYMAAGKPSASMSPAATAKVGERSAKPAAAVTSVKCTFEDETRLSVVDSEQPELKASTVKHVALNRTMGSACLKSPERQEPAELNRGCASALARKLSSFCDHSLDALAGVRFRPGHSLVSERRAASKEKYFSMLR